MQVESEQSVCVNWTLGPNPVLSYNSSEIAATVSYVASEAPGTNIPFHCLEQWQLLWDYSDLHPLLSGHRIEDTCGSFSAWEGA